MIQVCDPPRQRQVRRLSAEEFFTLVRCGGAGFYRPRSEVLRMLTAGEAWGTAGAALLVLPLTADTAAAAALRNWLGRRQLEGGCLLTPPVNTGEELPARTAPVWVPLEDRVQLALLLAKGYAALDSRPYGGSLALALYPLKETE